MLKAIQVRWARLLHRRAENLYLVAVVEHRQGLATYQAVTNAGHRCFAARQRLKALGVW